MPDRRQGRSTRRRPAAKRKSAKRKPAKRKTVKRKTVKRKTVKRKAVRRKPAKRKTAKRSTAKRKTIKRKPVKRKPVKRKTAKRKPAKRRTARRRPAARRRTAKAAPRRRLFWTRMSNDKLLDLRLRQLGVRIPGTWVQRCVKQLGKELAARGIRFRPHVWVSHDWFSPDGVPGMAIPFYLLHPRLMRLERRQMLEVEGGTHEECMRILRHECGHAVQHAYRLHLSATWRRVFGSPSRRYPEFYRPNPASRRFVQHLRLYYAQSHPVEDFAETFAVWLQPRSGWRRRYADWPALRKLQYVDGLMKQIAGRVPPVRTRRQYEPLRELGTTLRQFYVDKRGQYAITYPDTYDRELKRIFSDHPRHRRFERASKFLRRHRADIRRLVSRWTGEYQFTLDQVLREMIGRCRELKLRAVGSERQLVLDFALLLTVKTVHFLYSRRNWVAL